MPSIVWLATCPAFARNEALRADLFRKPFGNAHHKASHERDHHIFGTMFVYLFLNMRDAHRIQRDACGVAPEDARQLHHFFFRLQVGIGITVKMQTIHVHAAFGDHVPRHGTVDAARNEQKSASRRTYGHAGPRPFEDR